VSCRKAVQRRPSYAIFRDRLRADPGLVAEYVAAKRAILEAGVCDGDDYAVKKGKFIATLGYKGAEGT
jgi:GrpB-like predicted nucleotidyltransferase (UPF0157 family)